MAQEFTLTLMLDEPFFHGDAEVQRRAICDCLDKAARHIDEPGLDKEGISIHDFSGNVVGGMQIIET